MLGKNHAISACSGWLIAQPYLFEQAVPSTQGALLLAFVLLGSLLPDIDHPDSLLGRRVKFISVPMSYLQGDAKFFPWSEQTHSRGITHSIWAVLACGWLFTVNNDIAMALSFGFVAHLIGDALTPAGIGLFWPLNIKIRSPLNFKTGGILEYIFTYLLALFGIMQSMGFNPASTWTRIVEL